MKKLLTEKNQKKQKRNAEIRRRFKIAMKAGSDKVAVIQFLADDYEISTKTVYNIINSVK